MIKKKFILSLWVCVCACVGTHAAYIHALLPFFGHRRPYSCMPLLDHGNMSRISFSVRTKEEMQVVAIVEINVNCFKLMGWLVRQ